MRCYLNFLNLGLWRRFQNVIWVSTKRNFDVFGSFVSSDEPKYISWSDGHIWYVCILLSNWFNSSLPSCVAIQCGSKVPLRLKEYKHISMLNLRLQHGTAGWRKVALSVLHTSHVCHVCVYVRRDVWITPRFQHLFLQGHRDFWIACMSFLSVGTSIMAEYSFPFPLQLSRNLVVIEISVVFWAWHCTFGVYPVVVETVARTRTAYIKRHKNQRNWWGKALYRSAIVLGIWICFHISMCKGFSGIFTIVCNAARLVLCRNTAVTCRLPAEIAWSTASRYYIFTIRVRYGSIKAIKPLCLYYKRC
jgi:hypothetical protein